MNHVLTVYSHPSKGFKLLASINFEMYKYNYRFNGLQIVIKSTEQDPTLFIFDINPSSETGAW